MFESVRRKLLGVGVGASLVLLGSLAPAAGAADFMLVDSARLASLPTSGVAYASMMKTADDAMASMDLSEPASSASPWLSNYVDPSTGIGNGAATLAAALVYARTGDVRYRDFVVRANRFVIGSEDSASTNGTGDSAKMLAVMRQISGYVLSADLVGMDPDVTGSRAGYGATSWKAWLAALRTKSLGSGNCTSIVNCNMRATNWGAWASASRIAIDVYLNDSADLASAVGRLKLYLGESMSGAPWIKSGSYDATWACVPAGLGVEFVAVNGSACGADKDGVIVEDASRSAYSFPGWDKTGIDYSFHAYGAQLAAALVLDRQGYDVWNWGDRALKRIMDRLDRLGVATGNGRVTATHVSWIPRHFYGVDYPTVPAQPSDTLGYTDWLYGSTNITFGKLTRNTQSGTAVISVHVPAAGKLVLTGKGLRRVTKWPVQAQTLKLRVKPTAMTISRLRRDGRAMVRARFRFSEAENSSHTLIQTIELLKKENG